MHGLIFELFAEEQMNDKKENPSPSDNHRIINGRSLNQDCEVINGKWTCQAIEIKKNEFVFNTNGELVKNQKD